MHHLRLAGFLCVFAVGCSSSTTGSSGQAASSGGGSSGGGGTTTTAAANCQSRCEAKATECSADDPPAICESLCANAPSEEQATCLENSTCSALSGSTLPCGIGSTSSSSSGGSTTGSSSSSGSSGGDKGDPPGSPCGSANDGVNDCAPIGCKCNDGYASLPASVCTNGSCASQSSFCSDVCKEHDGWSGS